jgi:hypothetical protein
MIPVGFPQVAPALTAGELFGPLAPLALVAALAALVVLIGLLAGEYSIARRRQSRAANPGRPVPAQPARHLPHAA